MVLFLDMRHGSLFGTCNCNRIWLFQSETTYPLRISVIYYIIEFAFYKCSVGIEFDWKGSCFDSHYPSTGLGGVGVTVGVDTTPFGIGTTGIGLSVADWVVGLAVVGLAVGNLVVGVAVVGLAVGDLVVGLAVGEIVVGFAVGTRVVGWLDGLVEGFRDGKGRGVVSFLMSSIRRNWICVMAALANAVEFPSFRMRSWNPSISNPTRTLTMYEFC